MLKKTLLTAALVTAALDTQAATSFNLTIGGRSTNSPNFTLTNTSATAELLTFSISIGLLSRNFDAIFEVSDPAGGTSTVTAGDGTSAGTRFDLLALSFSDFDPGKSMGFRADFDQDAFPQDVILDYHDTLFNNGPGPNSELTATFSDGASVAFTLPDQTPDLPSYSFDVTAAPIPLPAGLPLLAAGVGALAVLRRRKR